MLHATLALTRAGLWSRCNGNNPGTDKRQAPTSKAAPPECHGRMPNAAHSAMQCEPPSLRTATALTPRPLAARGRHMAHLSKTSANGRDTASSHGVPQQDVPRGLVSAHAAVVVDDALEPSGRVAPCALT